MEICLEVVLLLYSTGMILVLNCHGLGRKPDYCPSLGLSLGLCLILVLVMFFVLLFDNSLFMVFEWYGLFHNHDLGLSIISGLCVGLVTNPCFGLGFDLHLNLGLVSV